MAILKCNSLFKTYQQDNKLVYALNNCDIEIYGGECVAVCGDKNSGKTTLLRLLGGLERPTGGSIYINHKDISSLNDDELAMVRRKEVGYLFQKDTIIPELSVHENIIMPSLLAGIKYDRNYYKELTNHFHISGMLSRYPRHLSAKQLRCVIYARALINKPNLIIIDEPSDYIDQQMDREVVEYLLNQVYLERKTLIMVTDHPEVNVYVDHIIKLKNGVVVENRMT